MTDRIQTRLTKPLAAHVARVTGPNGLYPTPSHYMQDLIRRDMDNEDYRICDNILEGFKDIKEGRYFKSTGDFKKDMEIFKKREEEGWK